MKKKIMKIMLVISSILLILFGVITMQMLINIRDITLSNSEKTGGQVEEYSDEALRTQITERLSATALGCAYILNQMFGDFAGTVTINADAATDIYTNPEKYGKSTVLIPDKSEIGMIKGQFVYAEGVDPEDEAILEELSMIGSLQGNLTAMYNQYDELGASYIGTETGIVLLAGPVIKERWDANGNYVYLDPRLRPWYVKAKAEQSVVFTDIQEDYDTGKQAIMCGVPIYKGKEFVGVAGAGLYLQGVENMMMNAKIGDEGDSCIIDGNGKVIFSSRKEGQLSPQSVLVEENDKGLSEFGKKAASGESGLELLDVDGVKCYLAYSPVELVGWSLVSIIPEKTVLTPNEKLLATLKESHNDEYSAIQKLIKRALVRMFGMIVAMAIITVIASNILSKHLVKPITLLTDKVHNLEGENLDFEWNENTGDEIQELATSFGQMTDRMKTYISDIQRATAEKERIGAELNLATQIQASMLPHDFPPFPDRPEFDIYAMMDPAREVGGDFYDFFLIDDDHLGLVMADVSGKGIPAALFMMISKVILQSCAMLGQSAAETLNKTNEALSSSNQTEMFVTVWFGILEISTGKLSCANAGHEYPAIKRADGSFEIFKDKHGFVIGGMEGIKYKEYEIQLEHGDKLFVYTDGVPEATNADVKMFGPDRMLQALNKDMNAGPEQILANVRDAVSKFVGDAEQFDDLTMMCVEFK
jgi:sigma-B regulation protein RsbU (phosphoserine phosphatase)